MTGAANAGGLLALDSAEVIARHDPAGFHRLLEAMPTQAREAWRLGQSWPMPGGFRTPSRVVFLGMGGSAIGADMVATLARLCGRVPVEVVRHYQPPQVDADTLVIAASFSGNTEETLAAFEATLATPGMRIAMTTGGRLAEIARGRSIPLLDYTWDGPPRTALGFGMFVPLALLARLGAIDLADSDVEGAFEALADCVRTFGLAAPGNAAKQLAVGIGKRLPLIVGADFLEVSARRFAGEISENAKQWAFCSALPEFDHNTLQAVGSPAGMPHAITQILLDAPAIHPRNRRRVAETVRLLEEAGARPQVIDAGGETPLQAIVRANSFATWTSYYMAMLVGVDPLPVPAMDVLKQRMAQP